MRQPSLAMKYKNKINREGEEGGGDRDLINKIEKKSVPTPFILVLSPKIPPQHTNLVQTYSCFPVV